MVKIQSISDIITNSSSEVFVIYDQNGIDTIKDIVNSILKLAKSEYSCDDLFDIQLVWDDIVEQYYNDAGGFEGTGKTFEEYCQDTQDVHLYYREGCPIIEGIKITPKLDTQECKEAADTLSLIDKIFESDLFYC